MKMVSVRNEVCNIQSHSYVSTTASIGAVLCMRIISTLYVLLGAPSTDT